MRARPRTAAAIADPLAGTLLLVPAVCRTSLPGASLGGSAVGREPVCGSALCGSALGGSALGDVRLSRSTLGRGTVALVERWRRAPRSGVPAAIRRRAMARATGVGSAATQSTAQDGLRADGPIGLEPGDDF